MNFRDIKAQTKVVSQLHLSVDDHAIEALVRNAVELVGDGFIDIQKGGRGSPYQLEMREPKSDIQLSRDERLQKIQHLKEKVENAQDEGELKEWIRQLSELKKTRAIIWINAPTEDDYVVHANVVDHFIRRLQKPQGLVEHKTSRLLISGFLFFVAAVTFIIYARIKGA